MLAHIKIVVQKATAYSIYAQIHNEIEEALNNSEKIDNTVSLVVSKVGSGRAILFSNNPNFRGSWYGTNRLFLNAILLGDKIRVP